LKTLPQFAEKEDTMAEEDSQPRPELNVDSKLSPDRVALLGVALIMFGMAGFYSIPGMIIDDAGGSKLNNAFYCSVITLTT
jgi:hypothetical protein